MMMETNELGRSLRDGLLPLVEPVCAVSPPDGAAIPSAWPLMGYAPGHYMGRCPSCQAEMLNVDKRARSCLECAVREANSLLETARKVIGAGLKDALEVIAEMGFYTKLHPDENESPEVQGAYSEGVRVGYQECAGIAREALATLTPKDKP